MGLKSAINESANLEGRSLKIQLLAQFPKRPARVLETVLAHYFNIPREKTVTIPTGSRMKICLPDTISRYLFALGEFEPEVTAFMRAVLVRGMETVDVGAHFGYRTLTLHDLTEGQGRVAAFEPTPRSRNILIENTSANSNILVNSQAVSDCSDDKVKIKDLGLKYGGSNTTGEPRLPKHQRTPVSIFTAATVSLDDYKQQTGIEPGLIKLDCEGYELKALQGAINILSRNHPAIIFETGDLGRTQNDNTRSCLKLLDQYGYEFYEHRRGQIIRHQVQERYQGNSNLLAVHSSKQLKNR